MFVSVLSFDRLNWIKQFLFCGGLILLFWIIAIIFNLQNIVNPKTFIYYPLRLSSSYLLYLVSYNGYFKNILTDERIEIRTISKNLKLDNLVNIQCLSSENTVRLQLILNYINDTNCYLDTSFNLAKLSAAINLDKKLISRAIGQSDNNNFNDLINFYRIERAKLLLQDQTYKNYTNESIGFECGFNTKSTFYLAFKKCTKKTPTDFRK